MSPEGPKQGHNIAALASEWPQLLETPNKTTSAVLQDRKDKH